MLKGDDSEIETASILAFVYPSSEPPMEKYTIGTAQWELHLSLHSYLSCSNPTQTA